MKLTEQQEKIIDFIAGGNTSSNLVISAVAGGAKTSTLALAAKQVPFSTFLAYNKAIAEDLKGKGLSASTIHSLAYTLKPSRSKLEVGKLKYLHKKMGLHSSEYILKLLVSRAKNYLPENGALASFFFTYYKSLCQQGTVSPVSEDREHILVAEAGKLYDASLEEKSILDFDDLVLLLLDPQYKGRVQTLFVDESQDLGNVLIKAVCNLGKRVIAVGDPHQAIYQFRGANTKAFSLIKSILQAEELPLSYTFRCAQKITEHARRYVPHIQSFREESGEVVYTTTKVIPETPPDFDAYLSFTNKEALFAYASLCQQNKNPHYLGNYLKQLAPIVKDFNTWEGVEREISHKQQMLKTKNNIKIASELEGLESVSEIGSRLQITLAYLKKILLAESSSSSSSSSCVVSTIHGSKGLEWDRVFFVDSLHSPTEQNINLKYVAGTRARNLLHVVRVEKEKKVAPSLLNNLRHIANHEVHYSDGAGQCEEDANNFPLEETMEVMLPDDGNAFHTSKYNNDDGNDDA